MTPVPRPNPSSCQRRNTRSRTAACALSHLTTARHRRHHRHRHLRTHRHGGRAARRARRIVLSFILAGIGCTFAGLCYAEFAGAWCRSPAAPTPTRYATLGEVIAWFIGWDLMLEYLFAAATVAVGWSGYFVSFLEQCGMHFPPAALTPAPFATGPDGLSLVRPAPSSTCRPCSSRRWSPRSATSASSSRPSFNTLIVAIKVSGDHRWSSSSARATSTRANWHPFIPPNTTGECGDFGWSRHPARRGRHLLRLHRLRRHLHRGAGSAQPAARHADRHPLGAGASARSSTS